MIPEAFTYERAGSVAEALEHMGRGALPLAGGHSLLPALKLRLSAPEALVDIARIPELSGIRVEGGVLVIGACTRHRVVAARPTCAAQAAARSRRPRAEIGEPAVRNRGTIGGSLAQADPHGDLPAVALAVGAEIVVQSASGTRTIAADDFFVDYFTTALDEGELITEVRIPAASRRARTPSSTGARPTGRSWAPRGLEGRRRLARRPVRRRRRRRCAPPASRKRSRRRLGGRRRGATRATASAPRPTSAARPSTSATSPRVMVRRALEAAGA